MSLQSEQELVSTIADAARIAVERLFKENPNDAFYYCSLVTTEEGHTPCLTAWSEQSLDKAVAAEGGGEDLRAELKWSYADSPFYPYAEDCFEGVKRAYIARSETGDRDSTSSEHELDLRVRAMEAAMARLDAEGLFGTRERRLTIVIGAEVMPPDHANGDRMRRLNPPGALYGWLKQAAEPA